MDASAVNGLTEHSLNGISIVYGINGLKIHACDLKRSVDSVVSGTCTSGGVQRKTCVQTFWVQKKKKSNAFVQTFWVQS